MIPAFVRGANPVWFMVDLQGLPLNDEYYAFFLENVAPYNPKPVFQDQNGMLFWPFPIQFNPDGTLPDNIYFPSDPNSVYRIDIRHGNTQTDPLIREINNYVPFPGSGVNPGNTNNTSDNLVTNGQFRYISFFGSLVISTPGTYNIAPGWSLFLSGAGSSTITQLTFTGDDNKTDNPPFALQIQNTLPWSQCVLFQRFNNNGALWANDAVTMSILAKSNDGVSRPLSLVYAPSVGTTKTIASGVTTTGEYSIINGAQFLNASTNNQPSDIAFVDMQVILPPDGNTSVTNLMCIGEYDNLPLDYPQETVERTTDHLFHYYANELIIKPKKSVLTGWNFSLNPSQFRSTSIATVVSQTDYICDQTILYQEAASNVQAGFSGVTDNQRLQLQPVDNSLTNRFALIQYIDPTTIRPYWGYILSSLVRAKIFPTNTNQVKIKMRLIYKAGLPALLSNTNPIVSWAGIDPVFDAAWTEIKPLNDPAYTLLTTNTIGDGVNSYPFYRFEQFSLPTPTDVNETLAIVVYTVGQMKSTPGPTKESIHFDRISLVPNLFAVDTHPITYDENLRQCEYYYEKSYPVGVVPGTATLSNALIKKMNTSLATSLTYAASFSLEFKTVKRTNSPVLTVSSVINPNTLNTVTAYFQGVGQVITDAQFLPPGPGTHWLQQWLTSNSAGFYPNNTAAPITSPAGAPAVTVDGWINFHYICDARLGKV